MVGSNDMPTDLESRIKVLEERLSKIESKMSKMEKEILAVKRMAQEALDHAVML